MLSLCLSYSIAPILGSDIQHRHHFFSPWLHSYRNTAELLVMLASSSAMAMACVPSSSASSSHFQNSSIALCSPSSSSSTSCSNPLRFNESHELFCSLRAARRRRSPFHVKCSTTEAIEERAGLSAPPQLPRRIVGRGSKLIGCGSAVPKRVLSNDDLSKIVDTNDEWISVRTGIRNRRVLSDGETITSLSVDSSRKALEMANIKAEDIDLLLLCTSSPDDLFGSAPQIQRELGCSKALAFDITAACSGFVLGLVTGTRYIKGGGFQNVLVVGADALSRYVDWTDRGTCILFGDAAGALVLQAASDDQDSLLGFDFHSDGHGQKHLNAFVGANGVCDGDGGKLNGTALLPSRASPGYLQMNGKEVFRFAVRCVPQAIEAALEEAGLSGHNLDWLLLHQANQRILDAVAERLRISPERVISNLANYGNTSAASIPLALDEAVRNGKVKPGHILATAGFGAGLTWGSAIIKWG